VEILLVRVEKITLVRVVIADIYIFLAFLGIEGALASEKIVRERIVRRRIDFEKNCL
jgi:hypothetical protein